MDKPDIVIFLVDQWNSRYLGCAGHSQALTPNLDALAGEGMLFNTAYTPSPVCMPARVSIFSGEYPHSHGYWMNFCGDPFPADRITLFKRLQESGYTTAKIGKYHFFSMEWGQDYEDYRKYYDQLGLDLALETSTPFQGPFLDTEYSRYLEENGLLETYIEDIAELYAEGQYTPIPTRLPADFTPDGFVAKKTIEYIDSTSTDKPMFLCSSFPGPHTPLDAPGDYGKLFDPDEIELPENYIETDREMDAGINLTLETLKKATALYHGKIKHLDDRVGQVVDALKKRGNWENTIFIFTSDHGDRMGEHGITSKCGFEDGSVRVPLIVRHPDSSMVKGGRIDTPVSLLDLYPTIIDAAAGQPNEKLWGKSLLPLLASGEGSVHNMVFSEIENNGHFNYMLRSERWKWYRESGVEKLFDMIDDPAEMNDLIKSAGHSDILAEIKTALLDFLMDSQINQAPGYKPLFSRIGLKFDNLSNEEKKKIIIGELRKVHGLP